MKRFTVISVVLIICLTFAFVIWKANKSKEYEQLKANIAKLESKVKDWPNLARYREADAEIVPPTENENRVVFMGDSITDMWDDPEYGGFFPDKPYINRGISGQTTPQMLVRFRPDVIALKPKVVVILAGTNDIAGNTGQTTLETIEGNLMSMTELARANGIRVVLASLLPVTDNKKNKEGKPIVRTEQRPPEQIKTLNEWIKKYTTENDCVYLDYFSALVDEQGFLKEELTNDGLHANAAGYAIMGPLAEEAIFAALEKNK